MSVRPILTHPSPELRAEAAPVTEFDDTVLEAAEDLVDTLEASASGVGLCAPQLGDLRQILVTRPLESGEPCAVFVNPRIAARRGLGLVQEQCLSLPGETVRVWRSLEVRVEARDAHGAPFERTLRHLAAVCLQHELDHFYGRLLVDRMGFFRRRRYLRAHGEPAVSPHRDSARA